MGGTILKRDSVANEQLLKFLEENFPAESMLRVDPLMLGKLLGELHLFASSNPYNSISLQFNQLMELSVQQAT
jgi:hypothetical protein